MEMPTTRQLRRSNLQTAQAQGDMVLLKVAVGDREGWGLMTLEEFLQKLNLEAWRSGETLVGTILPRTPRSRRMST
jgi:hypothetical protein